MSTTAPGGIVDPLEALLESDPLAQAEQEGLAQVRDLGRDMVNYLFMALRTLALHSEDNEAVSLPITRFREAQEALIDQLQRVHLITVEGQMYVNDLRLKFKAAAYSNLRYVTTTFGRHGIGGLVFGEKLDNEQLKAFFLQLLGKSQPKSSDHDPFIALVGAVDTLELPDFRLERPYAFKPTGFVEDPNRDEPGRRCASAWVKCSLATADYFRTVRQGEQSGALRLRKAINELVDCCFDEPDAFLALHTVRQVGDPHINHSVNVASLALLVGRGLGLTKIELADLGVAALMHDLGYAELERERAVEGTEVDVEDRRKFHPVAAFTAMMRQGEYGTGLMRRLLVGVQHHMGHGGPGGFPSLTGNNRSVFTRLIAVCDAYDALQWGDSTQPGVTAAEALERLQGGAGRAVDPVMVKALSGVVGRWPMGSVVRLDSNELAVVTSGGRKTALHALPKVMVLRDAQGSDCEPELWDLGAANERRRITSALTPSESGILPHAVFFWMVLGEDAAGPSLPSTSMVALSNDNIPVLSSGALRAVGPAPEKELHFLVEKSSEEQVAAQDRVFAAAPPGTRSGMSVGEGPMQPWGVDRAQEPAEEEPSADEDDGSIEEEVTDPGGEADLEIAVDHTERRGISGHLTDDGEESFFWMSPKPEHSSPTDIVPTVPEPSVPAVPAAARPAAPERPTDARKLDGFTEARWRAYERAVQQVRNQAGAAAAERLTWGLWLEHQGLGE